MSKPTFVYVTYIAASPERVWEALTRPEMTEKYWFGYRVTADGKAGERMTAVNPAGRLAHDDPIIESDPPRKLVYGWKPLYKDMPDERPSRVTFLLEPFKGQTRLTVTHDEFEDGSRIFGMISKGWPAVLSSLKSFLEMGRGLEPSWGEEERKRAGEA
ncbi:MAG TPA: SRPBCC family protein [Pseudolabrys sp.]|uniref:SRPBCC family protein n=1 Tax=Pseudolabrys sp. TaxID=1960880 RepID=UPI002DDD2D07|nr:SRPBCC family protein [Pseudolabrys sp.]HEV2628644.1 SRPBCC family protein [Pseudolabrys sp.]